jgi:hypothetical protein
MEKLRQFKLLENKGQITNDFFDNNITEGKNIKN